MMFIGYSLQATLEQINRKGLLQGRIGNVRIYSGLRDEKDLHVASTTAAPLSAKVLFNFTSSFSYSLHTPVEAVLQRFAWPQSGIRSFLNSKLTISVGHVASVERKLSLIDWFNCSCALSYKKYKDMSKKKTEVYKSPNISQSTMRNFLFAF